MVARTVLDWRAGFGRVVLAGAVLAVVALAVMVMSDRFDDGATRAVAFFVALAAMSLGGFIVAGQIAKRPRH